MNFKLTKSSLNFKVYTSPAIPASGTENDIVIISSTPMENWILSSDAPTGDPMNKGDVWIQYSVSGNVFDIMNQHDFMLAITRIYQYISGIWMTVDASRYVGGVWDVVSSAFSATISITYPAKSTCVVTNSSGQTVASDTNTGSSTKTWTATVNATGTYTVTATATDGSGKSKSQSVSITAEGQSESVTLSYNILYQAGDTDTGFLSVGWPFTDGAHTGSPKIAYNTDSAVFTAPDGAGSTSGVVYFPDKIDLTPYTTLTADATLAGSINNDTRPEGLYIWSTIGSGYYQDNSVASALFGNTGKKILTIDVNKLSGEYYIGFGLRRELTPVETITLRKVELE